MLKNDDKTIKGSIPNDSIPKDSIKGGWVENMPASLRPYLRLARYDRPIGFWLLGLPGWIGLAFAALSQGFAFADLKWAVLIAIGALAMRGAGCTYNDIVDQDLDAKVARTAMRPLPARSVGTRQAWVWLGAQCGIGLCVLAFFPPLAQIIALSSLGLVAAYPFMKRITFWPQAWLGLTFNWALLVAYSAKFGTIDVSVLLLFSGLVFWTIGYDTIYACQDIDDDALIGVKSTARLFGKRAKLWVALIYAASVFFIVLSLISLSHSSYGTFAVLPFGAHLCWQGVKFQPQSSKLCLRVFKSNSIAALLLIVGLIAVG